MSAASDQQFTDRIRQVGLLVAITAMIILFVQQLYFLVPGFLGAVTLYILSRDRYEKMIKKRKMKRGWSALIFLVAFTLCILIPIGTSIWLLVPRIKHFIADKDAMTQKAEAFSEKIHQAIGIDFLSGHSTEQMVSRVGNALPNVLNSTAIVLGNFIFILFIAYFMLIGKEQMEKALRQFIPLRDTNVKLLAAETKSIVKANAIGIPVISIIQGCTATLGYWIFGVDDFVLWGFITGIFSFFPVIGTALIWIPLVINQFGGDHPTWQGVGLLLYSAIVIGNIDYLARISLLKRIGEVHPVVTIVGVLIGLRLFGFWGFIFGPLLVSYLLLLVRIYRNEFGPKPAKVKMDVIKEK